MEISVLNRFGIRSVVSISVNIGHIADQVTVTVNLGVLVKVVLNGIDKG